VEYIFKHALAQEVTYQSILLQKRRDLHAQVGQAIETLLTDRPEEFYGLLAYHYAKAEAWEKAQVYLLKAGDQAGRVAADTEALNHYQQALAAYSRAFGNKWRPVQRAALAHKMGEALLRRGEHTQAFEDLRRALGYLGHPLPASRWGMRLTILREIALQGGHRLLPGLFLTSPGRPVTEAVEEEGRIYESMVWIVAVNPEHFLLIVLKLLNFSERNGFLPGAIIGFAALQLIADFMGLFWLARYYAQKAVVLAESGQHPGAQSAAYTMRAIHENIQGQWYTSIEYAQRAADIQQQSGYWNVRSWALSQMNLADAYVHLGNFSRALEYSQELTRFGQDSGDRQAWCWGLARQGFARRGLGQLETAEANLTEAMELAKSVPDYQTYVDAGGELGQCYLCQGKLDKALTVFEECRRRSLDHNLMKSPVITRFRNGLVEAYLMAAGRSAGAERAGWLKKARRACSDALRQAKAYPPGKAEAMMLRGNYEWLKGKQTAAKDWWQRSLTLAETMEVRYNLARTHLAMGQYLGERAHLEKAEAIFSEIGAAWDLAQTK
jgi:tetratricopeptide (TPR) repeat protein